MWTSVKTKKCNFAVAICNYDGKVKHGLRLLIGDVIELMEECGGWYRGLAVKTKQMGIFPLSYVAVRDYELDSEGLDAVPMLVEDAVASEVCTVLREWTTILKNNFQRNQRRTDAALIRVMSELVSLRKELRSGMFALTLMNEKKMEVTKRIDWGNKNLGLHLVPRVNNEPVDIDKTDPIELFKIHEDSAKNSRDSKQAKNNKGLQISNHHLAIKFESIACSVAEDLEFHFALYDAMTGEFFTERVLLKVNRFGEVIDANLRNLVTVFTDLGERDFGRDAHLVVHTFRLGSLRDSSPPTKTPTLCYKRPFGGGVYNISKILKQEMNEVSKVSLKISPCSENDFPQLHESLIKKSSGSTSSGKAEIEFQLSLMMLHTDLETSLTSHPQVPKNAIITNKIGFPNVIMPDTDRNDLYLTIERGEFEKGSKTAQKNVEARVLVLTKEGQHIEKCISRGTGESDVTEYNSFIFYHHNGPRWNDTIRLRIPVDQFYNSHVRIEFRHCSNKDRTEKKLLGMCFIRLITDEFTTLADGARELCFYKFDDARRLLDPKEYLRLQDVSIETAGGSGGSQSNSSFRRSDREAVYISTRLCSTKFTQNATLLGILKWKLEPYKVTEYLNRIIIQNGEEIVKFLQYIMDALFDMMSPGSCSHVKPMSVFKAVIHVFHLLKDKRFERFIPVMDAYIANNFSASLVYKELAKCTIEILEGIVAWGTPANSKTAEQVKLIEGLNQTLDSEPGVSSVQLQMRKSVQVLRSITKCIVQSRILYLNCPRPGDREKDDFSEIMAAFYGALTRALTIDDATVLQLQIVLLHEIPGMLLELARLTLPADLCRTYYNLITSIVRPSQMELLIGKLDSLRMMAQMPSLTSPYECKTVLIPMYVSELSRFLKMDKDPKPVAEILMEILASLHCDQKLNVTLRPNLSAILDGLLEQMMNMVDTEPSGPHVFYIVACLTSMLQLMDERHLQQLLVRYEEKNQLEMFLEKLLLTIRNLIRKDHYPTDWLVMRMVTNQIVLQTSKLIMAKMKEALARKPFNRALWSSYFHFAVNFVTQPCLQLEKFSPVKRHKLRKKYGDLRLKMVHEFLENWQSLKGNRIHFIPEFVGPFLEMALVPEPILRKALMPIFFEMMLQEWENTKSFTKLENEIIDQLDILINKHKGDEEFKILFRSELLSKVQPDAAWSKRWKDFVEWATRLLDVLIDYRYVLSHQDSVESRMKCIFNLLNYYSSVVQRQEKYIHYVYRLFDLHIQCGNHAEAALTLKLHSDLLGWGSMTLPQFSYHYPAQFEWHRMEAIYQKIVSEFDKGKMWEYGLPFLEKLADVYKEKIMYGKLSEQLKLQAEFYQKILGHQVHTSDSVERYNPTYFLVRFFGHGFSTFLQNKEFIYRGNECENLSTFHDRFLEGFSGATILDSMNIPPENIRHGPGKYLQICVVTPIPKIDSRFTTQKVPESILSFYRVNDISEFYYDRPFRAGKKDENNDFKTLCCERTTMKTASKFPGVMRWFEVTSQKKAVLSPIEVAIDAMRRKNEELNSLVMQYKENPGQDVRPLSMMLKGIIDAPVMGGFPKYQEAFFNEAYRKENPQHNEHMLKLIELFNDQVSMLEVGMHQHKRLAPSQLQELQQFLEEQFSKLKLQISDSSRFIGYVAKKKSHDSDPPLALGPVNDGRTSAVSSNDVNVGETPNSKSKDKEPVGIPFLKRQKRDSNKSNPLNPGTQWWCQGESSPDIGANSNSETLLTSGHQFPNSDLKSNVHPSDESKSKGGVLQKFASTNDDVFKDTNSSPPPLPARKSTYMPSRTSSVPMHSQSSTDEVFTPNSLDDQQQGPSSTSNQRNSKTLPPEVKPRNSKVSLPGLPFSIANAQSSSNVVSSSVTHAESSPSSTPLSSTTPEQKFNGNVVFRRKPSTTAQNDNEQVPARIASGDATSPPGTSKKPDDKPKPSPNKPHSRDSTSPIASGDATLPPGTSKKPDDRPLPSPNKPPSRDSMSPNRTSPSEKPASEPASTAVADSNACPSEGRQPLSVKERMQKFIKP